MPTIEPGIPNNNKKDSTNGDSGSDTAGWSPRRRRWTKFAYRYGLAATTAAVTFAVSMILRQNSIQINLTILVVAAILIPTWFAGRGPGIFAVVTIMLVTVFSRPPGPDTVLANYIFGQVSVTALLLLVVFIVSARRTAEKNIKEQREWLRVTLSSINDGVIATDIHGVVNFINPMAESLTGWTKAEAVGLPLGDVFAIVDEKTHHPADDTIAKALKEQLIRGVSAPEILVNRSGEEIAIVSRSAPIKTANDQTIGVVWVFHDISDKIRAGLAVRESEERYRDLVENAIDIIYTLDLEGNYLSVNKAAERITGYTAEETLNLNLSETVAPEYLETAKQKIADKLAGHDVTAYEVEIIAKDQRRIPVEVNTRIITENGIPVRVQGIARDITERKHLEEQFRQAQKMESIGVLAGGIAHDFNNLLTAISGYSELTLKKMSDADPLRHHINEIKNAGTRASMLTGQLLAFSRKQLLKPRVYNLNTAISEIEKMLRRIIRENVEFRTVLEPDLGNIRADPGQIEQVIMNLAVNGRDAMPSGGTLTIETENVFLDNDYVSQHIEISPGAFVRVSVSDTGEGMDEQTKKRIFEPFFTTKPVGQGTGLGLSTVYGIVKQSGGDIMVYSELGQGTTFKIYLPCVSESVQTPKWIGDGPEEYRGTQTILVVEDEEIVRNLVCEILTDNGYTVLTAESGKAALDICREYTDPIHLLLTDVIMPRMSGSELKDEITELRPGIAVIFMSGYTDDSVAQRGIYGDDVAFIEKPFTPDALSRKVREVLEA